MKHYLEQTYSTVLTAPRPSVAYLRVPGYSEDITLERIIVLQNSAASANITFDVKKGATGSGLASILAGDYLQILSGQSAGEKSVSVSCAAGDILTVDLISLQASALQVPLTFIFVIEDGVEIAGSGETNTASNVGDEGAGVFKQKTGVNLEFRKLKAGSNVTITEESDEIVITASGGGGSSHAFYDPDKPQVVPNAVDDEFPNTSLDVKWSQFGSGDMTVTVADNLVKLAQASQGSYKLSGIYQALAAGDCEIIAKLMMQPNATNFSEFGLCLLEDGANTPTTPLKTFGYYNASTSSMAGFSVASEVWSNRTTYSSGTQPATNIPFSLAAPLYFRIRRIGTNYTFFISNNGVAWNEIVASHALTFTPQHFGLYIYNNGSGSNKVGMCDWIRRYGALPDYLGGGR